MNFKDVLYSLVCLSFSIVIGGAVYEHCAVVPRFSAAPPASLAMFQGQYGLNAAAFWTSVHPVTMLLFISVLVAFWKTARMSNIIISFAGYFLILVITGIYFVPELLEITNTPYSSTVDGALTDRANLWETLSLIRLAFLIGLSLVLFLGLTKSSQRRVPGR